MIKFFIGIIVATAIIGCSAQKEIPDTQKNNKAKQEFSDVDSDTTMSDSDGTDNAMNHFIDGSIAEAKGDYASAILEYQDALRLDPKAGIHFAIAKSYFFLNKIPHALSNCKKAVEMDPTQIEYRDLLADIFTRASQFDSAAVVLQNIIKLDSTQIQAYYRLARIYENSKPLQAIEIYNKLTNNIGPDWDVLIRVAELYEKLGMLTDAEQSILKLLTIDPSNTELQKLLAQIYLKDKKYDEALNIINEVIRFTPDDMGAVQIKAQLFIDQDKWETASKEFNILLNNKTIPYENKIRIASLYFIQSLKDSTLFPVTEKIFQAIDKDTTDWEVKMYLGAIAMSQRNDSTAIKYFKKVTELASWNSQGWIRLGGLYFDNQKYGDAEKFMREANTRFPDDFVINLILGLSIAQQGKNSDAKPFLKKAVVLNPNDLNALSGYAYTLSQLNENEEAVKYLKRALAISPNDVNLLGTLGLIYNTMHKNEESDSVYQKALSIDSTNALVNNNYAYALSERGINLDNALRMIKIAIAEDSVNSSYLDTMGWVYFKLKKYELAKGYIKKAIHYGGESATMLEHLGDIIYMMGKKNEALECWEKAYELDGSRTELKNKIDKGVI
ncbi:MAG TPA: tetratricopeptide repeat protein [Ignavibacteriaceae bacterium]|nr:tetratricopeptide repeat protein [Ignavibacteriaceae bacterium]